MQPHAHKLPRVTRVHVFAIERQLPQPLLPHGPAELMLAVKVHAMRPLVHRPRGVAFDAHEDVVVKLPVVEERDAATDVVLVDDVGVAQGPAVCEDVIDRELRRDPIHGHRAVVLVGVRRAEIRRRGGQHRRVIRRDDAPAQHLPGGEPCRRDRGGVNIAADRRHIHHRLRGEHVAIGELHGIRRGERAQAGSDLRADDDVRAASATDRARHEEVRRTRGVRDEGAYVRADAAVRCPGRARQ